MDSKEIKIQSPMKKKTKTLSITRSGYFFTLILCLFVLTPLFGQEDEKVVQVLPVRAGVIETKPQTSVTIVYKVINISPKTHEFIAEVELPKGWLLVTKEFPFELGRGEQTIRLVNFLFL